MLTRPKDAIALVLFGMGVLAFGLAVWSASHEPTPSSREQVGIVQQQTTDGTKQPQHYGGGTEEAPFVVKVEQAPTSQAEAEKDANYRQREVSDQRVIWWAGLAVWVGAAQAVALFVTFLIIAFVAIRQLRAYIYPSVVSLKTFSLTDAIIVSASFKNAGQTPAKHFECHGVDFVGELPLDDNSKLQDPKEDETGRHSKMPIYPGARHDADFDSIDILEPPLVKLLMEKPPKSAVYVAGEARYRDIFHIKRKTQFCLYINSDDMAALIDAAQKNVDAQVAVRFAASHIYNDFT